MTAEIKEFIEKYYPEEPRKILKRKVDVPLPYIILWYQDYGCNNKRRFHSLPLIRKRGLKRPAKTKDNS